MGLAPGASASGARAPLIPPDGPETWTDEGALLEACRIAVHAIPGEPGNLKVTVPADLARVRARSFRPRFRQQRRLTM